MSQLAGRAFDPSNWKEHYAGVKARIAKPPARPVVVIPNREVIIRRFVRALSEREIQHNEYLYLSALAVAANTYCANQKAKTLVEPEAYNRLTVRQIIDQVCQLTGFTYNDIISGRRQAPLVLARQFAVWRAKNETPNSYPQIAKRFGGRDHSTAIASVRKIERLIAAKQIPEAWLESSPAWSGK